MAAQDKPKVAVSVDLDGIGCYYRIHGLGEAPPSLRHTVLRRCLPRFAELFARHDIKATFFVVGSDLDDDPEGRAILADLARAGHELANHTHTHPYDFTQQPRARMASEIDRAHDAIAAAGGRAPAGFRAPGYAINRAVLELLLERGYTYDSSVFPSPPYYAAKALVMGAMRLFGRRSASVLDDPRAPFAPRAPYDVAPDQPYRPYLAGRGNLLEIPIAVTPAARLHVIGTSLILAPAWLRRRMVSASLSRPFFNLELHGIDLADADSDQLPLELIARQPDLRRTLSQKRTALEQALGAARQAGAAFTTLAGFSEALRDQRRREG
jgi:peptidoglycan/xylan/chitin deacetylase (PgdA/CDA1 family)